MSDAYFGMIATHCLCVAARPVTGSTRSATLGCLLLLYALSAVADAQQMISTDSVEASQIVVGYDQVREIIRKRCVVCHNPEEMRGDLNLSGFDALLAGASSGPIVVAGQPNQSLLYKSAAHLEDPVMPPNSPRIPGRELDLIRRWIDDGLAEKTGPRNEAKTNVSAKASMTNQQTPVATPSQADNFASGYLPISPLLRSTAIAALDTHPAQHIAAISGNQQAVLLDLASGKWIGAFDFPEGDVTALRFSRDGRWLIVGGGVAGLSGHVVAFDILSGRRVFELADENDTILSMDLSPDGSLLALGGPAKVVRIYKVDSGEVLHTLRKHTDWVLAVRFSPDGLLLASGDRFGGLIVWDPQRGQEFHALRGHAGAINALAWDMNNETLVSGGEDGRIRTWNMHHGELTSHWDAGVGAILSLANDGPIVACGGRQKKLTIWRGPNQQVASIDGADQVERVAISADATVAVSGDALGNIRTLELDSLRERTLLTLPIDDTELLAVFKRISDAEADYAIRPRDAVQTFLPTRTSEPKDKSLATVFSDLQSEVESARNQIQMLRKNAVAMKQTAVATAEAMAIEAKARLQLQQAQADLQSQLEKQEAALARAEKHMAAIETIYQKTPSANRQLSADETARRQRQLRSKLERQQKLLDSIIGIQDELAEGSESSRARQLAVELTNELRKSIESLTEQLNSIGNVETPETLAGAQQ